MRFLLVSHVAPPHIGGVENLVLAEARTLAAAGHSVVWVTSDAGGAGQVPEPQPNVRIVRIRAWHVLERRCRIAFPLFAPSLLWHLWREVGAADVVHAHGLVFLPSPVAMCFARLRGKWSICTDHGGLLRYRWSLLTFGLRILFETLGRVTAHAANRLIAYNADVERLLCRLAGDRSKVVFLPNPVDATLWRPPTAEERAAARASLGWDERPRVLCIARLLPHKGIDVLLDAQDPAWRLVFCGPGEQAMREHIRARGGECLEPRPQAELRTLYHAADVFALPSHNEGFPVTVQEALACGLPVLTSDSPAYEPYRGTPGLHLCPPVAGAVREHLRRLLREQRVAAMSGTARSQRSDVWLCDLLSPLTPGPSPAGGRSPVIVLALVVLLAHLVLAVARLPGKVWGRRLADVAAYHAHGAVEFLLTRARLEGVADLAWLVDRAPPDSAVLWRWPADGALEFVSSLLAPRLLIDERLVPPGATAYAGRELARGELPDGTRGTFVVQGTPAGGLVLQVREH